MSKPNNKLGKIIEINKQIGGALIDKKEVTATNSEVDTTSSIDSIIGNSELSDDGFISASDYKNSDNEFDVEKEMMRDYIHPSPTQENFQEAIYKKREYIVNYIEPRHITSYDDIKEIRENLCTGAVKPRESQTLLGNFINPNTPYAGALIFWGTGVGKSGAAVVIAEGFKPQVEKYGTKIHVLVPGPFNKQNFISEILKITGETYYQQYQNKTIVLNEKEKEKLRKNAVNNINQYYRIMTHRSFYKKVLGEKIIEKTTIDGKLKITRKKTETGEFERDISIDRIHSLDNTVLIIDEAHGITDNEYGAAVRKIKENSKNLRIVLLTATPMKNLADDIVELINYLRPLNAQMERDKIFSSQKNHMMTFKTGGKEYLRKMVRGYVSYLRGMDPLTFAERIDMGEIPPGLDFIKVSRCYMYPFQEKIYLDVMSREDDTLDKRSEAAANFVLPSLSKDKTKIEGCYGIDGIALVKTQLKKYGDLLRELLAKQILTEYKITDPSTLIYLSDNDRKITGEIFSEKYLMHFSIKFYEALKKINDCVSGKKENGLIFVYSNLVRVGMELFQEVLLNNGYLEYQENSQLYNLKENSRCYNCHVPYGKHDTLPPDVDPHEFFPATFIRVTGETAEDAGRVPEELHKIIRNVYNNIENKYGKYIKIILGSRVIGEGITLNNIKENHILDVHYNLGRVDQVTGRGVRFCTHYNVINDTNKFPTVNIYKYVVSFNPNGGVGTTNKMTAEEELYKKAELKYKLVKETERVLMEEAFDCPLNMAGNVFPIELDRYKNCGTKDNPCPAVCGYMQCEYKCGDKLLNAKYYDPRRHIYKKIEKADVDYSTYHVSLAVDEINQAKGKIKEMFKFNHVYTLKDIIRYVKKTYPSNKKELFDDFYVHSALNDLIPVTTNDFNNFKDTITDKFNRQGYLIYRNKYYIFNPFNENENLPMYYRKNYRPSIHNKLELGDYITNVVHYKEDDGLQTDSKTKLDTLDKSKKQKNLRSSKDYDFDSVQEYYDARDEFDFVGIVDRPSEKKILSNNKASDDFKIRQKKPKFLAKKRDTGIPSFKGAVCETAKDKKTLDVICKKLNLSHDKYETKHNICEMIKNKLLDMEKYSTDEQKNKMTYVIIPSNHPVIPFPLNLEDRIKYVINSIQTETRTILTHQIKKTEKKGAYPEVKYVTYHIIFADDAHKYNEILKKYGAELKDEKWVITLE